MAVQDTKKLLEEMFKSLNDSYARDLIDNERQIVTLQKSNIVEAWKEGYHNLLNKHSNKDFPVIKQQEWEQGVSSVWSAIKDSIIKNKGTIIEYTASTIVFTEPRKTKGIYDGIKNYSVAFIQAQLKTYTLTDAKAEKSFDPSISFATAAGNSDIGQIKKGTHRLHQGSTTVGGARLALSMKWMTKTRFFKDFTSSKEAKKLEDKYGEILATFTTKGSKKKGLTISPNEDISVLLDAGKNNYPGSETTDWSNIRKDLRTQLLKWANNAELAGRKGSISINDNAVNIVHHNLISELSKVKGAKVLKKTKSSSREAKKVSLTKKGKSPRSTTQAKAIAATKRKRAATTGISARPLALIGIINRQLPQQVAANMGYPYLEYKTGRFASGTRITEAITTAKGFISFGYTYDKFPYQTFEPGYAQGDINRDPRKIIDRSIREIAAQFALGRFYTRRV